LVRLSSAVLLGIALAGSGHLSLNAHAAPALGPGPQAAGSQRQSPVSSGPDRALLDKYCVTCHNQRLKTAGLTLDTLDVTNVAADGEVWEKVVRKLRSRAMPPLGLPRPDEATYSAFAARLETALDRAAAANPDPGRPTIHRLNRVEYTNAIRDLLALDIDGRALLPADEAGYGFDNIADVLSVSPALLQRYLIAAQKVSRLAVGDPSLRPVSETYDVPRTQFQEDRASEELPLGSRGGIAVRHYFPLDGEYSITIRLRRQFNSNLIRGIATREEIEVRLDGERVTTLKVGGELAAQQTPEARAQYQNEGDRGLEIRFPARAGLRLVGISFLERTTVPEGMAPERMPVGTISYWNRANALLGVDSIQIGGPFGAVAVGDTPSRRQIFVCRPSGGRDEESCATKILARLARLGYRRPATQEEVETLLRFYRAGRRDGSFDSGIQFALEKLLVSLDFLFRSEIDPASARGRAYRISDLELASRLSFFLWSSIPDDELLGLADRGRLKDAAVLRQQVQRMLGDPRASALVSNFGGQWLHLRNVRVWAPDPHEFPEFDEALREAFLQETELFFASQLREDRSVVDLLRADYTFVNERLARHYGIPNVYGEHFRRMTFSDGRRAGLLGHGSILTVTSYPTRTSPVLRGKWLLENVLGAPPPPPPPNVPLLEENGAGKPPTSVRERLEQHRRNPACAVCHSRMDPLGFALENFDAIGRWRTLSEGNTPVDTSGVFLDGSKFDGPTEFRNVLLRYSDEFVATVTEKLLTYALGRGLESSDMPAVRGIVRGAADSGYRWSSLILGIVTSTPFQMRAAQAPGAARSIAQRREP